MITRVHIDQHALRENRTTGSRHPVMTVLQGKSTKKAHRVSLLGPGVVVYSPDKPLHCGATVWIETRDPVELIGEQGVG